MRVNKPGITASIVADLLIAFCNEHGDLVTNLKLQKLLYYAQAWYLAIHGDPLFPDRIEAWIHGPALPDIFARFVAFDHRPIDESPREWRVSKKVEKHIEEVMAAYSEMSSFDLERISCNEAPWIMARKKTAPSEPSSNEISHESMESFYKARLGE